MSSHRVTCAWVPLVLYHWPNLAKNKRQNRLDLKEKKNRQIDLRKYAIYKNACFMKLVEEFGEEKYPM